MSILETSETLSLLKIPEEASSSSAEQAIGKIEVPEIERVQQLANKQEVSPYYVAVEILAQKIFEDETITIENMKKVFEEYKYGPEQRDEVLDEIREKIKNAKTPTLALEFAESLKLAELADIQLSEEEQEPEAVVN